MRIVIFDVYDLGGMETKKNILAAVGAGAVRGDLIIRKRFPNGIGSALEACLVKPGTTETLLPPLHCARLIGLNAHSMVIEGQVTLGRSQSAKSRVETFTTRWLCKLPGAPVVLNPDRLKRQRDELRADIRSNRFHPALDDVVNELPDDASYGPLDPSITM